MSQSKFKPRVGDWIVFFGNDDSSFEKNGKYKVLSINELGQYPFNEPHHYDLMSNLNNPRIITIKDKTSLTFFLIYTIDGFYRDSFEDWNYVCDFDKFDIERRLRKEKLKKLNEK